MSVHRSAAFISAKNLEEPFLPDEERQEQEANEEETPDSSQTILHAQTSLHAMLQSVSSLRKVMLPNTQERTGDQLTINDTNQSESYGLPHTHSLGTRKPSVKSSSAISSADVYSSALQMKSEECRLISRDLGSHPNTVVVGSARRSYLYIWFHLIDTPWITLLWYYFVTFLLYNFAFGALFYASDGVIDVNKKHQDKVSIWRCVFFAVQAMDTIGFGGLVPNSEYANWLVVASTFIGNLYWVLVTGLSLAKFQKPSRLKRTIMFSSVACMNSATTKRYVRHVARSAENAYEQGQYATGRQRKTASGRVLGGIGASLKPLFNDVNALFTDPTGTHEMGRVDEDTLRQLKAASQLTDGMELDATTEKTKCLIFRIAHLRPCSRLCETDFHLLLFERRTLGTENDGCRKCKRHSSSKSKTLSTSDGTDVVVSHTNADDHKEDDDESAKDDSFVGDDSDEEEEEDEDESESSDCEWWNGYEDFRIIELNFELNEQYDRVRSMDMSVPLLTLPWTVTHAIDKYSPLYGVSLEEMVARKFEVIAVVDGIDEATSENFQTWWSYVPSELRHDHEFVPMVKAQIGKPSTSYRTWFASVSAFPTRRRRSKDEALKQFLCVDLDRISTTRKVRRVQKRRKHSKRRGKGSKRKAQERAAKFPSDRTTVKVISVSQQMESATHRIESSFSSDPERNLLSDTPAT